MFEDQLKDWRVEFSKWWQSEFKTIRFPSAGTVFHYYIETETKKWLPWESKVLPFELDMDIPIQVRIKFLHIYIFNLLIYYRMLEYSSFKHNLPYIYLN